ncbi:MAG: molybdopterin-binding protein [Syntrophobacteraceae bacterium]|nr:molybdopterin-binding protein [Syntrophobacteraceae bacterium]
MNNFLKVKTAEEVLRMIESFEPLGSEKVDLYSAVGRILAEVITAPESVPHFDRSVMDGFAVRARDTFGASESQPALLQVGGEVRMGEASSLAVEPGNAIAIPTGGMLPAGADAVVMVEHTGRLDDETIEVMKPVAPGENVLMAGEDIRSEDLMFSAGKLLRPQDIGALAALGIDFVSVYRKPRVAILSTGDEIVPVPTSPLPPGKIRDINSFTLSAQVSEVGAITGTVELVGDDLDSLVDACRRALDHHDVILISGGSSVGVRDLTVSILDFLPQAQLLVHGVAVRPGKPTILAKSGKKILWGLPGHPISAMTICRTFVLPCLYSLQGLKEKSDWNDLGTGQAVLTRKLPSVHGRTDYVPVVLSKSTEGLAATPIFGKSAMIGVLTKSDGYVIVPQHVEGLDAGSAVRVHFFHSNFGR